MPKFRNIQSDIESQFASTAWTTTGITAVPSNYDGPVTGEFVRINILNGEAGSDTFATSRINGLLRVDMFVPAADADRRANEIADILDGIFQFSTLSRGTQLFGSSIANIGSDPESADLWRYNYNISFIHYSA